jgi:hypothetical protein
VQSTIAGRRMLASATVSGLLFAMVAVGPALAATGHGNNGHRHTGEVGQHSLRDSLATPGAECRYQQVSPSPGGHGYEAKLRRLYVQPPRVRAIAGVQTVGWGFVVQRTQYGPSGPGPWSTTYQSPIQRMSTNTTHDAPFTQKSINVVVPSAGYDDGNYGYRVMLKISWYRANGSTQGTATHRVKFYRLVNSLNYNQAPYVGTCEAWKVDDTF